MVQLNGFIFFDLLQVGNVGYLFVFSFLQVMQDGFCSDEFECEVFYIEFFYGVGFEMICQFFMGVIGLINLVFKLERIILVFELFFELFVFIFLVDDFVGFEFLDQFFDVFEVVLCNEKFVGVEVQEGNIV